jgi:HEAT repeat protein
MSDMPFFAPPIRLFALFISAIVARATDIPDFYGSEVERFSRNLRSARVEERIAGVRGISGIKHWESEPYIREQLSTSHPTLKREAILALARIGTSESIPALRPLLNSADWEIRCEAALAIAALERSSLNNSNAQERAANERSIPTLARQRTDAAAWALGRIGGPQAETALLKFPKTIAVLLNLDRLHSTNCAPFLPTLIHSFGLVTYRAHPDDIHFPDAQPIQKVSANLILRSGLASLLIEGTLRDLEKTSQPPISHSTPLELPPIIAQPIAAMAEELKPGFVRGDGETASQPIAAVYHVADDPTLASRLRPLLRHPAIVPRIYVAMLLGKLKAADALPDLLKLIHEPYAFSDSTALASGKHFEHSQTIRWRGYICMAVGKLGTDEARAALERLALDPTQPRDVRYGAVIGLGFIGSPLSKPALQRVAISDAIWMVRQEAEILLKGGGDS